MMYPKLLVLFCLLLCISCEKRDESQDEFTWDLPSTPLFSQSSYWAVASQSYVKILTHKEMTHQVEATIRKGDVLEVQRREWDDNLENLWLYVVYGENITGWIEESQVQLYDSAEQAVTASKQLGQQ